MLPRSCHAQTFYQALQGRCDPSVPGTKGLVVDVGGNFGWFSTFSALLGCRWVGCCLKMEHVLDAGLEMCLAGPVRRCSGAKVVTGARLKCQLIHDSKQMQQQCAK